MLRAYHPTVPRYDATTALIVVDIQNDFADPAGSLHVPGGETVIRFVNEQVQAALAAGAHVFYTQDWHPPRTPHFVSDGGIWPVHCVAESWGAALHPKLRVAGPIVRKGRRGEDGYSGFTMRDPQSGETRPTELPHLLREAGVRRVVVVGLATDYCVKSTALDALSLDYPTTVLASGIRAVDLTAGDGERALADLEAAGATIAVDPDDPGTPRTSIRPTRLAPMTTPDERPYSPGLQGVIAGETTIALVDGENGRLIYRGYAIGELVRRGSYAQVAELLWTADWPPAAHLPCAALDERVVASLRNLPSSAQPMDALRTAISTWGALTRPQWPPTVEQARQITALAPSALAAFGRLRQGLEPVEPDPQLDVAAGFLYQLNGERPDEASARALDAYFIVAAEHGFNASTFTARVITSTRSDIASAVVGAIGALKGPLHGGAPAEVVSQLHEIGSPEHAEEWIDDAFDRGERLMGFGHRVYRAYDPRAAALREVAEQMGSMADWLSLAVAVEDVALRKLEERYPDRPLKTNVEYYTAAVLQGVGLPPDLFPSTFALARTAGWTAHALEQAAADKLIRPDVRYIGPAERSLPGD